MNSRILVAFLVSASLTGCVISGGGGGGGNPTVPGDVTFQWSLNGSSCSAYPEVKNIRISIPGESLENGGLYPCLVAGYPGIVLHDFAPGSYSYSIEALGWAGEQLFVGTGVFTVDGDVSVSANLQRVNQPGDVTFSWTFGGKGCAAVPDVKTVVIAIPGETLPNGGAFNCLESGYPGIVLHDFAPGSYSFTIAAYDYVDFKIFETSGTFVVNGNVAVVVDLKPVAGANSYAYLTWSFPPNAASQYPNCTQAGVAWVDFRIDGGEWLRYPCEAGFNTEGVPTDWLTTGTHAIEMEGYGGGAYPYLYYRFVGTLTTTVGSPAFVEYTLPWAVGGVAISWSFSGGYTCAQAGVSTVYIDFQDAWGNMVYGGGGDPQPCTGAPVLYDFLHGGTYKVYVTGGTWKSSTANPPTVTITNGEFADPNYPKNVVLY